MPWIILGSDYPSLCSSEFSLLINLDHNITLVAHFSSNRLLPSFIDKAKRTNRYKVTRNSSYKQIIEKQKRITELATENTMRLRIPGLHDKAPKEVTPSKVPPLPRAHRSRVFTGVLMRRG
jgi:hypothetical protein